MNKEVVLRAAFQRILDGKAINIARTRKLSVRAVEEEALAGDGTAYYYDELIKDIKGAIASDATGLMIDDYEKLKLKHKSINNQFKKLKSSYKEAKNIISMHAATLHEFQYELNKALTELELARVENKQLKGELVAFKKQNIVPIKN